MMRLTLIRMAAALPKASDALRNSRDLAVPRPPVGVRDSERVGGEIGVVIGAGERVEFLLEKGHVCGPESH